MTFDRPSYSLRAALLGAVALAALGAVAFETSAVPVSAAAATAQPAAGPASFADVVDRVKPAVVSVKVKLADADPVDEEGSVPGLPDFPKNSPFYHFFRRFGMPNDNNDNDNNDGDRSPRHHFSQAQGSGFFISSDGYIVTNDHVVDHATEVTITTSDGKSMPAKVIGIDSKTDLALLKAQGDNFPNVSFASQAPRVGDWVIAVGNPFGLGGTVTAGIVSARGRDIGSGPYDDFLQIDAPVNHGNSGGPTFNAEGEVVGVNTAIFSPSGGSVGIGFAIASDVVKNVVEQLKANGSVTRGWIGVQIQNVTQDLADDLSLKDATGALVAEAEKNSPAETAGVKVGDVITAVNGDAVPDPHELARRIAALGPKKMAELSVWRNGAQQTIDVTLGAMPTEKQQQASLETPSHADEGPVAKLGMKLERAKAGEEGVHVTDVDPDSAAAERGIQSGDIILDAGGKSVTRPEQIIEAFTAAKADGRKAVLLRVKSDQTVRFVALPTRAAS